MSDLTMAKVRALYEDMVQIEQNMVALERKVAQGIAAMGSRPSPVTRIVNKREAGWVVVVRVAVLACALGLELGLSLASSSGWRPVLIAVPIVLAVVWVGGEIVGRLLPANSEEISSAPWLTPGSPKHKITRDDFERTCLDKKINGREKDACADVIFGNLTVENAARNHKLGPTPVASRLLEIFMQQFQTD